MGRGGGWGSAQYITYFPLDRYDSKGFSGHQS